MPASMSARISSSVAQRTARSSLGSGLADPRPQPGRDEQDAQLVGHRVGQEQRHSSRHASASKPVSSASSRRAPASRRLVRRGSALGDLPAVGVQRVAVLADQQDAAVVRHGHDAHRQVPEVDDPVDPGAAVRPVHLVVEDLDPRVGVGGLARAAEPGAHGGRRHHGVGHLQQRTACDVTTDSTGGRPTIVTQAHDVSPGQASRGGRSWARARVAFVTEEVAADGAGGGRPPCRPRVWRDVIRRVRRRRHAVGRV